MTCIFYELKLGYDIPIGTNMSLNESLKFSGLTKKISSYIVSEVNSAKYRNPKINISQYINYPLYLSMPIA